MTWRELSKFIETRGKDFRDDPVSVYAAGTGEFFPADTLEFQDEDEFVIPLGLPFLVIQN